MTPTLDSVGDKEYDEEDVEVYRGDRTVLGQPETGAAQGVAQPSATES